MIKLFAMNNLKSMLSKSSVAPQVDETFEHLSIDDFFADVMKAANMRASENYTDTGSTNWKTDVNTFRAGASFALKWFSDKIEASD